MCARRKYSPLQVTLLILCLAVLAGLIIFVMVSLNRNPYEEKSSSSNSSLSQTSAPPQTTTTAPVVEENPFDEPVAQTDPVDDSYFDDALFVGDSITTGIELYGVMPNATVVASTGINPSTILTTPCIETAGGTVTILEAMTNYQPKKIYIMLGSNGVQFIDKETMMDLYGEFVDQVKECFPDCIIYLQSILPVTQAMSDATPDLTNDKIDEYNEAIFAMAQEKEVYYLNVAESFKDSTGALPEEASPYDGMHFGEPRYQIWMEYLRNHAIVVDSPAPGTQMANPTDVEKEPLS